MNHPNLNEVAAAASPGEIDLAARHQQLNTPSLRHLWHDDSGQDLIEYALVAALVGLGALAAMKGLKNSIDNTFNGVGNSLTNATA